MVVVRLTASFWSSEPLAYRGLNVQFRVWNSASVVGWCRSIGEVGEHLSLLSDVLASYLGSVAMVGGTSSAMIWADFRDWSRMATAN